jgi:streptomycin 6-kinase
VSPSAFVRDLPAAVRAKAGDVGADAWLTGLPDLVSGLAREWGLRLGEPFRDATEAYVVRVTRRDGRSAVLKLLIPGAAAPEITFLRQSGDACCRLLAYDVARNALLLERLGPAMSDLDLPPVDRLTILTDLAAAVWRPVPSEGLVSGAARASRQYAYIAKKWDEIGEAVCSRGAVDQALAAGESRRRAHDPERAVLVHGDVHQWNALSAGDGFKLVDPDGVFAEPECDLGVLMREDPVELMAGDPWARAAWLADCTGTDPRAIWEWGLLDRVATGLTLTIAGVQPVAAQMLAAADAISRAS